MQTSVPPAETVAPSAIELLVLFEVSMLLLLGVMAVTGPVCTGPSNQQTAKKDIANLLQHVETYELKYHECPQSLDDLRAAGFIARVDADPWGNAYVLICPDVRGPADILSAGRDGSFGSEDDIRFWSKAEFSAM